jgi:hypothetical protein
MLKQTGSVLLLLLLCGCLQTKDDLTINGDGSGTVHMEIVSGIPPELAENMGMMSGGMAVVYPPISESEARKFFPAKDFKVTTKQQRADKGDVTTVIDVDFKDINALLASPYGHAHQLSAQLENGTLVVKAITGMESSARFAEMKEEDEMGAGAMANLGDLQKRKSEMRADFRITLPNAVTGGNGTNTGKIAAWSITRAQSKDAEDFARKLGTVCEARCSADGLKFTPTTPVRLALYSFAQLTNGANVSSTSTIDTNKVAAAVKFVPYGLTVTRSLDLSGNGSTRENTAQLIGALVVPPEYAPKKWGAAKLEEVTDAKGNDLKPKNQDEMESFSMRSRFADMSGDEDEDATNKVSAQRHVVTLAFRPPDWKVNEIAKIKGSASLQYFGASQTVVKLTNAIPAKWIMDMSKGGIESFDGSEKILSSAALTDLGLALSVSTCMAQGSYTILSLATKGTGAMLADAQVFDSEGKPWPTSVMQSPGDESSVQIAVAGKPQAPLSLALLVGGAGAVVEIPISMEHVTVTEKP